jgi:hypothetical protein
MGDRIRAYRPEVNTGFNGEPERWRPLGRPRHRWQYNIKMYIQEVGWTHALY